MDLEDKDGLTPLMHGLLAVRSSMDSESAVRAVSVLAQHSKPGSLRAQEDRVLGHKKSCLYCKCCLYDALLKATCTSEAPHPKFGLAGEFGNSGQEQAYQPL